MLKRNMTAKRLNSVKEYYFSKKLREVASLIRSGKPIINLGIGSPDLIPSNLIMSELIKSVSNPKANHYQSYQGIPELRKAISDFYKKHYFVSIDPGSEVLPLIGSKEGIMHISMAFLNPGDHVLIPNPGYPTYSSVTKLLEANPVFYDLKETNSWLPDLKKIEKNDLTKVKIMWINYPHMPTGAQVKDDFFKKLIIFAKKHKILIVNDNPYSFILTKQPKSFLTTKGAIKIGMELNSLSKSFNMAGWRVGMLVGNPSNIKSVLKVKSNMDSGMYFGIQKAAIKALSLSNKWFDDLNTEYRQRRIIAWKIADKLNASYDNNAVGLFIWAKLSSNVNEIDILLKDLLYKKNIFITPGKIFGSQGDKYIRISLCVEKSKLEEALNRL